MSDRRVLYLDPREAMEVRRDGPALLVSSSGKAPHWYPVRRLTRVVSRPQVSWNGDAMRLLIDSGVPLLFVEADGRLRGLCLSGLDDALGLGAHLDAAMAQPSWPAPYRDWYRSQERRVLVHLYDALGWPKDDLRPGVARARLALALGSALGSDWRATMHPLHALLRAQVVEGLMRAGLDPAVIGGVKAGVSLGRDIAALLGWPLCGRVCARPPRPDGSPRAVAGYYSAYLEPRMAASLRRMVAALWRLRAY